MFPPAVLAHRDAARLAQREGKRSAVVNRRLRSSRRRFRIRRIRESGRNGRIRGYVFRAFGRARGWSARVTRLRAAAGITNSPDGRPNGRAAVRRRFGRLPRLLQPIERLVDVRLGRLQERRERLRGRGRRVLAAQNHRRQGRVDLLVRDRRDRRRGRAQSVRV